MRKTLVKNQQKKISKKSTIARSRASIFSLPGCHASHSQEPIQLELEGFPGKMHSFFSTYYSLSSIKDRHSYSLKMLKDCSPTRKGAALQRGSFIFKKWGTMRNGRILTGHPLGCAVVMNTYSSLAGIIKTSVPKKYYLTGKNLQYILSRLSRRNGRSFNVLLPKIGQDLIVAQLYLMSMDSECSYQKKKRPYLGFLPGGPPSLQNRRETKCLEMFGRQ